MQLIYTYSLKRLAVPIVQGVAFAPALILDSSLVYILIDDSYRPYYIWFNFDKWYNDRLYIAADWSANEVHLEARSFGLLRKVETYE